MHSRFILFVSALLSLSPVVCFSQDEPVPIKDNSFLIEEAYNQEPGVVQHIVTAQHFRAPEQTWDLAFTQEVPGFGIRHQLSWTVPFKSIDRRDQLGIGDVAVHNRFQLLDGSSGVAFAPRVSVYLPSGDEYSRGEGVLSWQASLPVSVELSSVIVMHLNAGTTLVLNRRILDQTDTHLYFKHNLNSFNFGGSLVWLLHENVNVLLEALHSENEEIISVSTTETFGESIINPGIRVALNTSAGQFVPGLAIPIRIGDKRNDVGVFGYFSFEHSL